MSEFSSSLLREKITFRPDADNGQAAPVAAEVRSNRVELNLVTGKGRENVVLRGHTTYLTLALAHKIMFSFNRNGLFLQREEPYDWAALTESVLSDYEKAYNPNAWVAIYINGKPIHKTIDSPYMDVIEKCALLNEDYEVSVGQAEEVLRKLGQKISIDHAQNVAAVLNESEKPQGMRCGIIQRTRTRDMTFNFTYSGGETHQRIEQAFQIAGCFMEAIMLRMTMEDLKAAVQSGKLPSTSPESRQFRQASARLRGLQKIVDVFETQFKVRYRPERPDVFSPLSLG